MKQIRNKTRSRSGETLAEVLVALLVATLALMILAGMISSTTSIVKASESKMDDYYAENAKLENISGTETPVTITIEDTTDTPVTHTFDVKLNYYENQIFGASKTVTAYKIAP